MQWIKPDFEEISLGMEATAYVNTDAGHPTAEGPAPGETPPASRADDADASE
jgi:coenzyme PQQ precursor peptide PqqA